MVMSQRQAQEKQRKWAEREQKLEQKNALAILKVLRKRLAPQSKGDPDYTLDIDAVFIDHMLTKTYTLADGETASLAEIFANYLPSYHEYILNNEAERKRISKAKREAKNTAVSEETI